MEVSIVMGVTPKTLDGLFPWENAHGKSMTGVGTPPIFRKAPDTGWQGKPIEPFPHDVAASWLMDKPMALRYSNEIRMDVFCVVDIDR